MADTHKTVIITGANGNLGSAVTQVFLNKSYRVLATLAEESMKKDMPSHPNLELAVVNLSNEEEAGAFVQSAINKYGKLEGALLLVGGFMMGNIASTTGADLKKQFSLNFETAYYTARPIFQQMLKQNQGRIIFIGARPAISPAQGKDLVAYSLSKSLLFRLAELMNEEARGKNVTASVVAPSTLDTPLNRKSMPEVDPADWVKPAALAEILEFLVSDKGSVLRETVLKVYNNA